MIQKTSFLTFLFFCTFLLFHSIPGKAETNPQEVENTIRETSKLEKNEKKKIELKQLESDRQLSEQFRKNRKCLTLDCHEQENLPPDPSTEFKK